ncbi:uncharacterized protein LOC112463077 [Temnothorax curvispinosus]|uniref:Uncharacterized protein LOC112463077 n=1 Tax=Temnothorax curvispinosus TaxID=300111 RepID=A0A6J1QVW2_9HYME|nr:uncharacterized protein LOC112463077 [Temnothorax curvispinosus]
MATAMGSSAECQQLSFDSSSLQSRLHKAVKAVKAEKSASGEYSPPVQLFEQTTKDSGDDVDAVELQNLEWSATPEEPFDLDEIEKFIEGILYVSEEHSPPVPSPEQTTKNPDAVDTSKTSSSKDYDVDIFVELQTSERSVTNEQQLENLDKIDRIIQRISSVIKENSPSVPSPQPGFSTAEEYDMNPSERENDDRTRSEEQPDSQVLSSEQTTRNPGAVDT